ncbi:MAG: DUF4396 domain-containing protein [Chthoniobacterales bacterium]
MAPNFTDAALRVWFALTFLSVVYVAYDLIVRTPEMKVMKWGWVLVTLYTGPVALIVYWFSCREPAPGAHEKFIAPLWKQSVGSAIHCMAGDATGIIVAAAITSVLGLPMGIDAVIEYLAGFAFGLFIFQALFMKDMLGGSYGNAVKRTWLPEWLSMNAVMAGMIPVMIILMTHDMRAMEPTSPRFWGIMSFASLAGAVLAYPVNWWLVKKQLKHGMGTERALGKGGTKIRRPSAEMESVSGAAHRMEAGEPMTGMEMAPAAGVSTASKIFVTVITIALLAVGFAMAARFGDLSMRAGAQHAMQMP